MTEEEYRAMKVEHDSVQQAASEARGAKKGLEDRLRKEFKLPSLGAAKLKLKHLSADVARLESELETAAAAYQEEFQNEA
jgi:hypothetical protein